MLATQPKVVPVEMAAESMPEPVHSPGKRMSEEVKDALALPVGRGLVWTPCFNHVGAKGGHTCNAAARIRRTAAKRGVHLRCYHTKDGSLCVKRLA